MNHIVKNIKTDYYGYCTVRMYNVTSPTTMYVIHNSTTIFKSKIYDPLGNWVSACVEVPLMPGENEIYIPTNFLYWKGKNYTSVSTTPHKIADKAIVLPLKDVAKIYGSYIESNYYGLLLPYSPKYTIWGGSPYYNTCSPGFCVGHFLIHAPSKHKIYEVVNAHLRSYNLTSVLDMSRSYAIVVPTIDRKNTWMEMDGKKVGPGKYTVKSGDVIKFNLGVHSPVNVNVCLFDKKSNNDIWSSKGRGNMSGKFVANKDMQLEFRLMYGGEIVDRYG